VAIIDVTAIAWESITSLGGPFPAWGSAIVGALLLAGLGLFSARVAPAASAQDGPVAAQAPVSWATRINWPLVVLTGIAAAWGVSLYWRITWPPWTSTVLVVVALVSVGGWVMRTAAANRVG
jgi:hypothetical protein